MADIEIRAEELSDPMIDEIIHIEKSLSQQQGEMMDDVKTPFFLNPIFYYGVASFLGAFLVWCVSEPLYSDTETEIFPIILNYIMFAPVAGVVGLAIGLTYGISNRNASRAFYCAIVGLGVGLGVTIITSLISGWLFGISGIVAISLHKGPVNPEQMIMPEGMGFFALMCGRGLAWSIVAMGAGLGLGVALKSPKLTLNGLAGGMVGGMLGGLLFDPVHRFVCGASPQAALSRAIGFSAVGLLVGLFIGFFENISKDAWLLMMRGPLAGKQFILFKNPMIIGSAPKCDIYLFKDPAIEPKHARIAKSGNRFIIHNDAGGGETMVNGRAIDRYVLQEGDIVSIGETVLKYHEKSKR